MSLTVEELAMAYHGAWVELDSDASRIVNPLDQRHHRQCMG